MRHFFRTRFVLLGLVACATMLAVSCQETAGPGEWSIEDESENETTDSDADWTELNGVVGGRITNKVDGKLYGAPSQLLVGSEFGGFSEFITADGENWRAVDSDGLEALVAESVSTSYAETDDFRYLARMVPTPESSESEKKVELHRAAIGSDGSEDFELIDAESFERLPPLFATSSELFTYASLRPTGTEETSPGLYRRVPGTSGGWDQVSLKPDSVTGRPVAYNGELVMTGLDSAGEPHVYRYDPRRQEWSMEPLPRNYRFASRATFRIDGQLVAIDIPTRSGRPGAETPESHQLRYLRVREQGVEEVVFDDTMASVGRGLTEWNGDVYTLKPGGELARIDLERERVRTVVSSEVPLSEFGGFRLWRVGDTFFAHGVYPTMYEWSPGDAGWTRGGPTRVAPRDISLLDGQLWSEGDSWMLRKARDGGDWNVVAPPAEKPNEIHLMDDRVFAYSEQTGCLFEHVDDGESEWSFRFQFISRGEVRTSSCDESTSSTLRLTSIAEFRDGLAMVVRAEGDARVVQFRPQQSELQALSHEEQQGRYWYQQVVTHENRLWVASDGFHGRNRDTIRLAKFDGAGAWETIDARVVDHSGERMTGSEIELMPHDASDGSMWARLRVNSSDNSNERYSWFAQWSPNDRQFQLLPAPADSDPAAVRSSAVTNLGPVAATDQGIFHWTNGSDGWRQLPIDLPEPDSGVSSLAADADRLVLSLENKTLWQRDFPWQN